MTRQLVRRSIILSAWLACSAAMLAQSGSSTAYDRGTETTLSGTILHLFSPAAPDGNVGVHFDLKTATGMVNVHVAPAMFIGMSNFSFFADESVTIIGSRMTLDGNNAVWAKAIQKGSTMLVLRADDGTAKWPGADDGVDGCGVNHPGLPRGTER